MTGLYRRSVFLFGLLAIVLGFSMLVAHGLRGRRHDRLHARRALHRARHRASLLAAQDLMARKLPQLQRALDAPALASVAYGEIASSIYFALGVIALHALGFTPVVLGVVGLLFLIVTLSYAEGTASIRETGGAATFVRVAFNDLAGFLTGWVLFLDYLIVIALSALFVPHYLGLALGIDAIARRPGDVIAACVVVAGIAAIRLLRRTRLYGIGIAVPLLDLVTQVLLVIFGFAFLFSGSALTRDLSLGTHPSWHDIAFALPLAMLAYTGLETVANYAEEVRRPGRDLPRSLFSAVTVVVIIYILIACVGLSAYPSEQRDDRSRDGLAARADDGDRGGARSCTCRTGSVSILRVYVGLTGRARAAGGDDDVDLRLRPARLLARRARAAAAGLRPAAPADARRAGVRRRGCRDRDRAHHRRPRSRARSRSSRASSASASCSRSPPRSSR